MMFDCTLVWGSAIVNTYSTVEQEENPGSFRGLSKMSLFNLGFDLSQYETEGAVSYCDFLDMKQLFSNMLS